MANDTIVTIGGNTTAPAELRFAPNGAAVATFTVASTPRTFDKTANEWRDSETLFMRCTAWREMAENVAETLSDKGMRVIVQGRLVQRSFETRDGDKRTVIEMQVDEIAPSLAYATAKVTRASRGGGGGYAVPIIPTANTPGRGPAAGPQQPVQDPWATSEEAPF